MSIILFCATLMLDFAGFLFGATYIWLKVFSSFSDAEARSTGLLKAAKTSMVLSLSFALLTSFLSSSNTVESAISRSETLLTIIAITWLIVLLACGIIILLSALSSRYFKPDSSSAIKHVFKIALPGAIIGALLAWLLS